MQTVRYLSFENIKVKIIHADSVTSTNSVLRDMADNGEPEGTVFIAEAQTAGKGTRDRTFHSPEHSGIYMSILVRPHNRNLMMFTPSVAVAVNRTFRCLGCDTGIKWVNDIYREGRKVCGILTESSSDMNMIPYTIVGIGINVFKPQNGFPEDIRNKAGYLFEKGGICLKEQIENMILSNFFKIYTRNEDISREYYEYSILNNIPVTVIKGNRKSRAVSLGPNKDMSLRVKYDNGDIEDLVSGEVTIIPEEMI